MYAMAARLVDFMFCFVRKNLGCILVCSHLINESEQATVVGFDNLETQMCIYGIVRARK